jgi:hypothetical protein
MPMPAGPPDRLGARIEAPLTREVVGPWVPAELWSAPGVDENGEPGTQWGVTATLPAPEGDFLIAWVSLLPERVGDENPVVAWVPLHVLPA